MYKREIKFIPGYDKRDPKPSQNFGIHGMEIMFLVKGEEAAVNWQISTGWMPKSVKNQWSIIGTSEASGAYGTGISTHSPVQLNEYDSLVECKFIPSGKCYGSYWTDLGLFPGFATEGESWLWERLEGELQKLEQRIKEAREDINRFS